jgi:polyhydroxybutyrate depolymerase
MFYRDAMNNASSNHWAVLGAVLIVLGVAVHFDLLPEPAVVANAVDFSLNLQADDKRLSGNDRVPQQRKHPHKKHDGQHLDGRNHDGQHRDRQYQDGQYATLYGQHEALSFAPSEKSASTLFQPNALRRETLIHDNVERTFGLYAPDTLGTDAAPMVFLLHGGGGSIDTTWEQEYGRNFQELADEDAFLLVLPQGREDFGSSGDHHWNDCRTDISNPDVNSQLDDVGFISAIIDTLADRFSIDLNRVYVTGASNGGMMSYRLAIELGQRFAAVGALIANLPDPSECAQPKHPISILIMNGTDDPLMNYEGGCVANTACRRGNVISTVATAEFWTSHNQTAVDPVVEELPDRVNLDRSTVTKFTYSGGVENTEVVLFRINNGGHTIPGDEPLGLVARLTIGEKNRDINGPEEIWNFFKQHTR